MKKVILSLIMCVLMYNINAQDKIVINGFVEIGYISEMLVTNEATVLQAVEHPNAFYSDINLDFSFKNIHLEQKLYNIFLFEGNDHTFSPHEILYKTRIYYKWKHFDIGVEHMCLHPLIIQQNEDTRVTRRNDHDKIFIRYTFGTNK